MDAPQPVISHHALCHLLDRQIALHAEQRIAVLLVKLNEFQRINTSSGYAAGDHLLHVISGLLASEFRPIDIVMPVGFGHIAVILPGMRNDEHAMLAANKVFRILDDFNAAQTVAIPIRATIGAAVYPSHAATAEATVQSADTALQNAVEAAEPLRLTNSAIAPNQDPLRMAYALETAIEDSDLQLHYQPQVSLSRRRIIGVEALSRWISDEHGFVPPDVFIALAESTGLIKPLTIWTLNVALKHLSAWHAVWNKPAVALNLSAALLHDPEIVDLVTRALNIWNVGPGQLTLEVTESAMMTDPERCLATINQLHELGIRLSIDDFGTGYSSLAYLSKLRVDELKIDKSFVLSMQSDPNNAKIVHSVIDLAHNFKLAVVAEGVEDESVCDTLRARSCDYVQGYFISKPLPEPALREWLRDSSWSRADRPKRAADYEESNLSLVTDPV